MSLYDFLQAKAEWILDHAEGALKQARLAHYERGGPVVVHERLEVLLAQVIEAARSHDLCRIVAHSAKIAGERYRSGCQLYEVQIAFNVLEEAIWLAVLEEMPVEEQGRALALLSTILGAGKDALAREFVEMARKGVPQMDPGALLRVESL